MEEQEMVAEFVEEHGLRAKPEYRLLDLVSEVGELSKGANESTGYGNDPSSLSIDQSEFGDVLFALLALADSLDVDANAALTDALEKYEARMADTGSPSSGE